MKLSMRRDYAGLIITLKYKGYEFTQKLTTWNLPHSESDKRKYIAATIRKMRQTLRRDVNAATSK